jgi:uncharacterized protein
MKVELIKAFLDKKNVFAVVGASKNPEKYGYKVYEALRYSGYSVYCVNPNAIEILGDKCYPTLETLPLKPDVVDFVVPPKITEQLIKSCKNLGITKVWTQPGSESEAAIKFCQENKINVIHSLCIMVECKNR